MLSSHTTNIDETVERLCLDGCKAVRLYIQKLENNTPMEQLGNLDAEERDRVLQELKDIMAVYERCEL